MTDRGGTAPMPEVEALFGLGGGRVSRGLERMETQHVLGLVLAAVAPFLPLIFLVMPAREVLRTLTRLLI